MNPYIKAEGNKVVELMISVLVFQEGDHFVAYCPSLNLSSYGNSIEDAKQAFDEIMTEYLQYAADNNSLHEDLKKCGWNFLREKITPPPAIDLDIPAGVLRQQFTENRTVAFC